MPKQDPQSGFFTAISKTLLAQEGFRLSAPLHLVLCQGLVLRPSCIKPSPSGLVLSPLQVLN